MIGEQVAGIECRQLNLIFDCNLVAVNRNTSNRHTFKDRIRLSVIRAKIERFSKTTSLVLQHRLEVEPQRIFAVVLIGGENGDFNRVIHQVCRSSISNGIYRTGFRKSFEPQLTRIAFATGNSARIRIVATVSQPVVDSQADTLSNDVSLGQRNQWRMNGQVLAFYTGFGGQVRHVLKGSNELGTAIRIPAVVDRIHTDKQIIGTDRFRQTQCDLQKDRVASRNIRHGDAVRHFGFIPIVRHRNIVGQRRAAKDICIDPANDVFDNLHRFADVVGSFKFEMVPLSVVEGNGMDREALCAGDCQRGRGVQATTDKYDCF